MMRWTVALQVSGHPNVAEYPAGIIRYVRARVPIAIWIAAGLMWTVFGLLYLFRIHNMMFATASLLLGIMFFLLALRNWRKLSRSPSNDKPDLAKAP
jgi:hypothetical protein